MAAQSDYIILEETPAMHTHPSVQQFIEVEVHRPNKQWISNILEGHQEKADVILRTDTFVLLPDTERLNRYGANGQHRQNPAKTTPAFMQRRILNWLCILQDKQLRTIRDLRGQHLPMLREMLAKCLETIEARTGIQREQVMAYVHYPPSVYQLHVHFSFPYAQHCHRDAYRVHSMQSIINNLAMEPEYYAMSSFCMPVYRHSPLHLALVKSTGTESEAETQYEWIRKTTLITDSQLEWSRKTSCTTETQQEWTRKQPYTTDSQPEWIKRTSYAIKNQPEDEEEIDRTETWKKRGAIRDGQVSREIQTVAA